MQDPSNDPYLKAADEFLALSKAAETPFMRAYYERVALRYLSSEGKLTAATGRDTGPGFPTESAPSLGSSGGGCEGNEAGMTDAA